MTSEAITKNDLKAILSEVLPPTPSEYKKLLWTNPSPTSAMSGGTTIVASGADEYDAIEVEYKDAHIYDGYLSETSPFVVGGHIVLLAPTGTDGEYTGNIYNSIRTISMGSGGVLQANGAIGMTASGTVSNNNMCIPTKIYGIKYERVAPPQVELPTYSTEEQVIGTWIDGKPIYRKVLTGTSTAGTTSINISSLNIAFPISANIIIHNTNGNWVFGSYIQTSGSDSFNMYMIENFSTVYLRSGSSYAFGPYWLILEYTKTTD